MRFGIGRTLHLAVRQHPGCDAAAKVWLTRIGLLSALVKVKCIDEEVSVAYV